MSWMRLHNINFLQRPALRGPFQRQDCSLATYVQLATSRATLRARFAATALAERRQPLLELRPFLNAPVHCTLVLHDPSGVCPPGSFSSTGLEPCSLCNTTQYQDESSQTACKPCPSGQATLILGASCLNQCRGTLHPIFPKESKNAALLALCPTQPTHRALCVAVVSTAMQLERLAYSAQATPRP